MNVSRRHPLAICKLTEHSTPQTWMKQRRRTGEGSWISARATPCVVNQVMEIYCTSMSPQRILIAGGVAEEDGTGIRDVRERMRGPGRGAARTALLLSCRPGCAFPTPSWTPTFILVPTTFPLPSPASSTPTTHTEPPLAHIPQLDSYSRRAVRDADPNRDPSSECPMTCSLSPSFRARRIAQS